MDDARGATGFPGDAIVLPGIVGAGFSGDADIWFSGMGATAVLVLVLETAFNCLGSLSTI